MRRFLPVMFAVALSLLAQTPVPSPDKKAEEHPASPCRVGGRVVTAAEGSPLKSARVALVPEDSSSDTLIYGATSDSDGHFFLKEVVPGRYRFFATRAGFVDQQYQAKGTDGGAVLALKPGQKISDVLFRMTTAAVITGRVNNEDGDPMIRVQVIALRGPTEKETEEESPFASRKQTLIPVASSQTDDAANTVSSDSNLANITYGRRTHSNPITMYRLLTRTIGFGNTSVANTLRCTTPE